MATLMSSLPSSIRKLPPHPTLAATNKPLAILSRDREMRVPYDLRRGQDRLFHELPSGLSMEVIVQKGAEPDGITGDPPLVFVHGSYHAAWCWTEHWLPFFSSRGFDCYALSLLGQVIPNKFLQEKFRISAENLCLIVSIHVSGWEWCPYWFSCWFPPGTLISYRSWDPFNFTVRLTVHKKIEISSSYALDTCRWCCWLYQQKPQGAPGPARTFVWRAHCTILSFKH